MAVRGNTLVGMLDKAMKKSGLTQQEVYDRYKGLGGTVKQPNTVESWLRGDTDPKAHDFALLCKVLNDACQANGEGRPLPDLPFLPRRRGRGGKQGYSPRLRFILVPAT